MLKFCPICSTNNIKKNGIRNGKQRFHCKECYHNFIANREDVLLRNKFIWFRKWIIERQVYKYLIRDSGMSQSSIQRLFNTYLETTPTENLKVSNNTNLLIDGTYFSNGLCLIIYYCCNTKKVLLYRFSTSEKYRDIKQDLDNLKSLNYNIYSVTCDGHKSIIKAIKKVYPNCYIQRCLVHIKRQIVNYLSENPQLIEGKELLKISKVITRIKSIEQMHKWLVLFYNWYEQNKNFINEVQYNTETKRAWFKHKNLHQATSHLYNAIEYMFTYINDDSIPNTTNEIEGYFTHLKEKLTLHRGLKMKSKKNFIKWYIYLKNNPDGLF